MSKANKWTYTPDLDPQLLNLVRKVWDLLDLKNRGYLKVDEFVRLGSAMCEEKPTILAAEFMLSEANISGTGRVDKDEWMAYAERLGSGDHDLMIAMMTTLVARLERDNKRALDAKIREANRMEKREEAEQATIERQIQGMMKGADAGQNKGSS